MNPRKKKSIYDSSSRNFGR